jgi:D-alanine-D-alanine ligase
MKHKKRIAVVFGGRSVEHEISVLSALQAIQSMDVNIYEVVPVYIAQSGKWYTGEHLLDRKFYKTLPSGFSFLTSLYFLSEPESGGLYKKRGKGLFAKAEERLEIDVFLPVFHGQYGEDGCVQGLFEIAEVAYAGPQLLASAIAMNKYICKALFSHHGIPVLPAVTVSKSDIKKDITLVCEEICNSDGLDSFPLFIKPANLGSSVGVSRANNQAELQSGLVKVFQHDLEAIVEPCVSEIMEINVSVIESPEGPQVSVVEVPVASGQFLSYEDKYMREGKGKKGGSASSSEGMASLTRVIDPENLDSEIKERVRSYALDAYRMINGSGVVRFDFMMDLSVGKLYFNELNPIPGSLSFYLWEKSDPLLLMSDILDRLIEGAERRKIEKKQLKRDFGFKVL